jgi:CheY-like chemotaxis protein
MTLLTQDNRDFPMQTTSISSARWTDDVNILMVDDDPRNLDVLESILDLPGYRLVRARSAEQALQALIQESFALLVLDVRMPEMSGLELAQLIKQRKKTQHLPIIFLTAYYREDEHVLQGYDAGAVDYLSKPCNPAVLRSKVAAFVDLYRINRALQEEIAERRIAEQRVVERTAQVDQLVRQLRALASELTQAEQRERKRLATILHDYIQQLLVSAQMQLASIRREPMSERAFSVAQQVDSILKEALDASRSLTVELSPPILQEAGLGAALKWLASRLGEKHNLRVNVQVDTHCEPATEEQRFLLFECARELLFNTVKHARVDEASIQLTRSTERRVQLVVADRGAGFDLELQRNSHNEHPTFGLFSIQQRLEHLGGRMEIDTAPGRGVRVVLSAPADELMVEEDTQHDLEVPEQEPRAEPLTPHSPIRVLVVDDHKMMRQGLVGLLQVEPDIVVVGEAEDGFQAVELAEALRPDVIIMDVNLGKVSGPQATRSIMSRNKGVKVIGLSMHVEQDVAASMYDAGASAYLTKGGALEDLITAIRSCCMGQPA